MTEESNRSDGADGESNIAQKFDAENIPTTTQDGVALVDEMGRPLSKTSRKNIGRGMSHALTSDGFMWDHGDVVMDGDTNTPKWVLRDLIEADQRATLLKRINAIKDTVEQEIALKSLIDGLRDKVSLSTLRKGLKDAEPYEEEEDDLDENNNLSLVMLEGLYAPLCDPAPNPKPLGEVLDEMVTEFQKFHNVDQRAHDLCALSVVMGGNALGYLNMPRVFFKSAEAGSGKTTLMEMMAFCSPRAYLINRATAASLTMRLDMSAGRVHFFLDETENWIADGETRGLLAGLMNTGYERGKMFEKAVYNGEDWMPQFFNVYSPVAIAGLGDLAASNESRAYIIHLKPNRTRKVQHWGIYKSRIRAKDEYPFHHIREQVCAFWASQPEIPVLTEEDIAMFSNREQDKAMAMIATAKMAGDAWVKRAIEAINFVMGENESDGTDRRRILLAIADVVAQTKDSITHFSSVDLAMRLTSDGSGRFASEGFHQLSGDKLMKELKPYGIKSVKVTQGTDRGLMRIPRTMLEKAFSEYIGPNWAVVAVGGDEFSDTIANTDKVSKF
mgnify:CR=1 FL=1